MGLLYVNVRLCVWLFDSERGFVLTLRTSDCYYGSSSFRERLLWHLRRALKSTPSYGTALTITGICIIHALGTAIANIVVTSRFPERLQDYASILGSLATLLAVIQYLPQIWTTYKLKGVGSLSIPMMCIQVPGSYILALSLAARLGLAGWSIWGLYMVTGMLQGVILIMGIVYALRARNQTVTQEEQDHIDDFAEGEPPRAPADETTPLVAGGNE